MTQEKAVWFVKHSTLSVTSYPLEPVNIDKEDHLKYRMLFEDPIRRKDPDVRAV